ncbi:MAG: hypothetical protein ACFE89_06875 [Candidatus Hodarchaeota archaeon]
MDMINEASLDDRPEEHEPLDPLATILFIIFGGALGYLLLGRSYGFYPWTILIDVIIFIPTWDAVATFLAILVLMFVGLIGGLMRMRYSKLVIGVVTLVAVFVVTFYTMYMVGTLLVPSIP